MMLKNPKYSAAFRQFLEDMEALKRKMDIDDEIYTEIQLRVGKINDLKKVLEQKDQEIERKDQEIEQKKRLIAALKQQLDA
jgi:predicted RNase H-like nuclease (RuvC/YqgF family)